LSHVDYQAVYRLKREVLNELAEDFFFQGQHQTAEFERFLTRYPEVETYADFAAQNSESSRNYHLYVQFQMDWQLAELALRAQGVPLYLDYPGGCNPKGFDMYHFKDAFLDEVTVGAPPDLL